ncbi:cytochrome P450, partial [Saccharothrix sp. MB29]|nr:cytochrome P450 [Saccharothrix sp. MB29]
MTETTSRPAEPAVPAFPSDRSCPYHPAPGYAPMGETRPLTRVRLFDGREAWLVTGHAEGRALLADQRLSSEWGNPVFPVVVARTEGREGLSLPLIGVDDPEHARQRRMLIPSFGVKRMAAMRPVLQQEVDRLIDGILADGPTIDLVSRFALPVPSIAICMLLGVPYDDHDLFEERSRDFVGAATSAEADAAFGALYGYLFDLVRGKQEQPGEGLLDELITVQLAEGKLDHDELVKMAMVLLIAGHETTGNAISLGVLALLEHPGQQQEGDAGQLLDGEAAVAGHVGQEVVVGRGALARDQFGQVRGQAAVRGHLLLQRHVPLQEPGGIALEARPV